MAGNRPEEQVRNPIAHQSWRHVTFLHWRYDSDEIARLLPDGLAPDVVDGSAWVGLTPFMVEGFRLPGTPALPVISRFPETNLRTYVVDRNGGEGLWFFSLDVDSAVMALMARLGLGIPYFPADMQVEADGAGTGAGTEAGTGPRTVRYESRRRGGEEARHRIEIRPGDELGESLSERDATLVGRWRAYTQVAGQLLQVPVEHEPWPLHTATLADLDQSLTGAAGLSAPEGEPLVHYAPGVDARFGAPRPVGSGSKT